MALWSRDTAKPKAQPHRAASVAVDSQAGFLGNGSAGRRSTYLQGPRCNPSDQSGKKKSLTGFGVEVGGLRHTQQSFLPGHRGTGDKLIAGLPFRAGEQSPTALLCKVVVRCGGAPRQPMDLLIGEAPVMPAAVVFEGELAGSAGRVPTVGVDDCTESSEEQRLISSLGVSRPPELHNGQQRALLYRKHRSDKTVETTLTVVQLPADVVLGRSPYPRVISVPLGVHFAVADRQAHLINGENCLVHAAPPQLDVGATVDQGQGLGADVQRQAEGRGHMEEPVTQAPLPQLGLGVQVAADESQVCRGCLSQTHPRARVLDVQQVAIVLGFTLASCLAQSDPEWLERRVHSGKVTQK
ncbi:hypothetical protein EYF80_015298 [Liparis tanakae]|uniref:Uncharacterized protein n=1 Tax=Liparis tanakae TaxID=230148 RepID=A0A4Z2I971_9TELE|nr:hypothetical protein EYF80_015298 [Liparis tanakae]